MLKSHGTGNGGNVCAHWGLDRPKRDQRGWILREILHKICPHEPFSKENCEISTMLVQQFWKLGISRENKCGI